MFLTAGEESLAAQEPSRFVRAGLGTMGLAMGCGLLLTGAWGLGWTLFHGYAPLTMPAAVTMAVFVLWPFRRACVSLADLCAGKDGSSRPVVLCVLVVGLAMCLMSLGDFHSGEYALPEWLQWVRPGEKYYRVLLLMPLWGAWSMLITPQFCRASAATEPYVAALARGGGAGTAAVCLVPPLAGSIFYFHYLGLWVQVVLSAVAVLGAIAAGLVCCRASGGLTRRALLAGNLLTQILFLLAYLPHVRR